MIRVFAIIIAPTDDMISERSLLELGEVCLIKVFEMLTFADRLRASRTCRYLHLLWRKTVRTLCITQQDLELYNDQPLIALSMCHSLILERLELDWDCGCFLAGTPQLQQLTSITFTEPSRLTGLSLVLKVCPRLTCLQVNRYLGEANDCNFLSGFELSEQRPHKLQHLMLLHSSGLSLQHLLSSIAADPNPVPYANCPSASSGLQCCGNASLQGNVQLQQLLVADAAADGLQLSTPHPAWPHLHTLDLSGCTKLGGSWGFLALTPNLHTLVLHGCNKVTNKTLETFSKAVHSGCTTGSDDPLTESSLVAGLHCTVHGAGVACALQKLDLSYTRLSDAGMRHVAAALPQLQWLSLKGCNVGDDGLLHLLQVQQLTALRIKHCHRVTEEGVQQLSVLTNLRELSFGYTSLPEMDNIAVAIAGSFRQLTALDLLSSELTDRGLEALGTLPQLQQLKLYQAAVTMDALRHFGALQAGQTLSALVLYGLGGLRQLQCLSSFTALKQLHLGGLSALQNVPESIKQLALLPQLRHLTLERIDDITVGSLKWILSHGDVHTLKLRRCNGVSQQDLYTLSETCAESCGSSATVSWASVSCDTDDEDVGWRMLPS